MHICICDDDISFCEKLKTAIITYSFKIDSEFTFSMYHAAGDLLACDLSFDVLFLDIRFGGKDIGIELAKKLRGRGCNAFIILVSSLPGYMQDGYKAEVLRYLVKPLVTEELHEALDTVIKKVTKPSATEHRFAVKIGKDTQIVNSDKLMWVSSSSKDRHRHLFCEADNGNGNVEEIIVKETLRDLYERLPQERFIYVHQSHLINLSFVKLVQKAYITTTTGTELPIGRSYRKDFIFALEKYSGGMVWSQQ